MASSFPGSLDNFTTSLVGGQVHTSARQNDVHDAINKIEARVIKDAPINIDWPEHGGSISSAVSALGSNGGRIYVPEASSARSLSSAVSIPNGTEIVGEGWGSLIRLTGNHYAFSLNPAQRCRFSGLRFDASSAQSSGGVFDFTNALFNVYIDHVYIDSNIHTAFNVKPAAQGGLYHFDHIRFNGGASMNTGFALGDGTNLVTDIHLIDVIATASTGADLANAWLDVKNNVDSLNMVDCLFHTGNAGLVLGVAGGAGIVSNTKLTNVVADSMDTYGFRLNDCSRLDWTACAAQSCGSASTAGVNIGGDCVSVTLTGGIVQACNTTGIAIQSGSLDTLINGVTVANNNTSNTASVYGIQASAGATDWAVIGCRSGNNLLGATAGHQKRGLGINTGASDRFRVIGNDFTDNETSGLLNNATGTDAQVYGNLTGDSTSVASATTITLNSSSELYTVTGTTTITSVAASWKGRRVTLVFAGILTFTDGSNLKLNGNFVTSADDTITLICDGTNWIEVSRSAN